MLDPFVVLAPVLLLPVVGLLRFIGCGSFSGEEGTGAAVGTIKVDTSGVSLAPGEQQTFKAQDTSALDVPATWSGSSNITSAGVYTAPVPFAAGITETITATSTQAATLGATATATVTLVHITKVTLDPASASLVPGESFTFAHTVIGTPGHTPNQDVTWSNAFGGTLLAPIIYVPGSGPVTVTATSSADSAIAPGTATVTLKSGNTATSMGGDAISQGSWQGKYGKDGYLLAASPNIVSLPAYVTSVGPPPPGTPLKVTSYGDPTPDPRGLQKPPGFATRFADAWIKTAAADPLLTLKFDFVDYLLHRVAIYLVDWDTADLRKQTIVFTDASQPSVQLASVPLFTFGKGAYLIFDLTGHVVLSVTADAGSGGNGPVMSGIFFG